MKHQITKIQISDSTNFVYLWRKAKREGALPDVFNIGRLSDSNMENFQAASDMAEWLEVSLERIA